MKRKFINIGILILFNLGLLYKLAISSFASFDDDYQGFLKTYDNYRSAHEAYIITRNQFLSYQSLNSKNDALTAVKAFLSLRDQVQLSYISLIRSRNSETLLGQLLDEEEKFLKDHQQRLPAIAALEDAVNLSGEVEEKHLESQILSRKIVGLLLSNKVDNLKRQWLDMEAASRNIIYTLKSQNKDTTTLERWLLDSKNKEILSEQKINQARNQLQLLRSSNLDQLTEEYNKIQFTIYEANQYLREALGFLYEFKESVKYGKY